MEKLAVIFGRAVFFFANANYAMSKKKTMEDGARAFAIFHHTRVLQMYDGRPYSVHLKRVAETAKRFIHLIPSDKRSVVIAACWLHDTIEDCRLTYNDIAKAFGNEVADIVFALSNEKGKTRRQRADARYYQGICESDLSVFVKVCDRIANFEYSVQRKSKMSEVYKREMDEFIGKLYVDKFAEMFSHLRKIG